MTQEDFYVFATNKTKLEAALHSFREMVVMEDDKVICKKEHRRFIEQLYEWQMKYYVELERVRID